MTLVLGNEIRDNSDPTRPSHTVVVGPNSECWKRDGRQPRKAATMQTILSGFLSANLLPIGDDDDKLKRLEDAAAELATSVEAKPLLAQRFALVGLCEDARIGDPLYRRVGEAVTAKWQTIANKVGASPIQVYRAVALRTLEIAASKNSKIGHAFLLVAQSQSAPAASSPAFSPIRTMLSSIQQNVEEETAHTWIKQIDLSMPKLSSKVRKPTGIKEDLSLGLSRAVGPTDKDGRTVVNPNPNWPNQGQPWAQEFVSRATDAINAAIQTSSKGLAEDLQEALKDAVTTWSGDLHRLATRSSKAELLWTRMSMYSPAAKKSSRAMDADELVIYSAVDISRTAGADAPMSVEFFLRETVSTLTQNRIKVSSIISRTSQILSALPEGEEITQTEELPPEGRRSWLDIALRPSSEATPFDDQAGVSREFDAEAPELAVLLYRELQIRKLLMAPT